MASKFCISNFFADYDGYSISSKGFLPIVVDRMVIWVKFTYSRECVGQGSGTPLQYSCLENPMDGGAWKAAVHGVAEGRTGLHFHFHFQFSLSCIGEGNGNPLQYSCLENPMNRHSRCTRGDRHPSRVEAKNPALLSSRDGYLLELTVWTNR